MPYPKAIQRQWPGKIPHRSVKERPYKDRRQRPPIQMSRLFHRIASQHGSSHFAATFTPVLHVLCSKTDRAASTREWRQMSNNCKRRWLRALVMPLTLNDFKIIGIGLRDESGASPTISQTRSIGHGHHPRSVVHWCHTRSFRQTSPCLQETRG